MSEFKNISQSEYNRIYGDFDLTEESCSPELWAYLNAPDEEKEMDYDEWVKTVYVPRLKSGYYDKK